MAMAPFSPAGGGNPSGTNVNVLSQPTAGPSPYVAPFPSTSAMPSGSQAYFPANTGGASAPNPATSGLPGQPGNYSDMLTKAFNNAGYSGPIASLLAQFVSSGSGFNPQVLQSLIASLQPQINRGEADIMSQFGSEGLGMSSPAAIGMGDFLSQVNLNEGQMATQLYEQSVQDYISVLTGGQGAKVPQQPSALGSIMGGVGSVLTGLSGFTMPKF